MQISKININGNIKLDNKEITEIIDNKLKEKEFFLFSRSNFFLFPKKTIIEELKLKPIINNVKIDRDFFDTINIIIEEKKEVAIFCNDLKINDNCFFLDENGFIFYKINESFLPDDLIVYRKENIIENPLGQFIIDKNYFKNINFFIKQLSGLNFFAKEVLFEEGDYVVVYSNDNTRLIINGNNNLSVVISNLSTILSDKSVSSSSEEFLNNLDYIRLDSGNKVFYKLK